MYAIVKTGGKQIKAAKDDIIIVDKLAGEAGAAIELDEVLLVVDGAKTTVGTPYVKGAKVKVEIVRQAKGPKINASNYKPKKNVRKQWGHRAQLTHVKVTEVVAGS